MAHFLFICCGGAVGTGARYALSVGLLKWLGPGFPFGTLAVNLIGSFLTAAIAYAGLEAAALSTTTRIVLTTGVMGGFTTYSAFSFETMRYLEQGVLGLAALNVFFTVFGCVAACFLGRASAIWLLGP